MYAETLAPPSESEICLRSHCEQGEIVPHGLLQVTATRLPVYLRQQRMDHELSGDRARTGCEAVLAGGIDQLEL